MAPKGTAVCQLNPVGQDELEQQVIKVLLAFYGSYQGRRGRVKLIQTARAQSGVESASTASARRKTAAALRRIDKIIQNLLDNITAVNRDLVDQRLIELHQQRERQQDRLGQFDDSCLSPEQLEATVADAQRFLASLGPLLQTGSPDEKRAALRRCIDRITIDKPSNRLRIQVHKIPTLPGGDAAHVQVLDVPFHRR